MRVNLPDPADCKTYYYRAPLNFTHFALVMITRISLALIYVQDSITMPNLAVIQLMRVIKWPRSDSDGSYVKINVRGNKGFYSADSIERCLGVGII